MRVVCSVWRNLQFSLVCEYNKNKVPKAQTAEDTSENKTDQIKLPFPKRSPSPNYIFSDTINGTSPESLIIYSMADLI